MNKYFQLILIFTISITCYSQTKGIKKKPVIIDTSSTNEVARKKGNKILKDEKVLISDYTIISYKKDTTFVDTSLSVQKDYKFNYLRKDNFNLIQFANTGQTYNTLSFDNSSTNINPRFAAQARHFNYMDLEDTYYYNVPTPLTELFYKTVFSQGQILDAFFTVNTSEQFNFSIAYKGMRSLGNYVNALTSTGNFRFTTNYRTKNGRYKMRGHIVLQDLLNQENGGLTDADVQRFIDGEEDVKDREVFDPNFDNAENNLEGKRFHLENEFTIFKSKDSITSNELVLHNTISFEDKFYEFNQPSASNIFFGNSFSNAINDKVTLEDFYADVGLSYNNPTIGLVSFKVNYTDLNYGYNSVALLNNVQISNRIKQNYLGFIGNYKNEIGQFLLKGSIGANLSDEIKGNFLNANVFYPISKNLSVRAGININNRLPNFNHLLYQSGYTNYNWDNTDTFETVKSQQISFGVDSDKYFNIYVDLSNISNYTYFDLNAVQNDIKIIKPNQYSDAIQYLRIKLQKEFKFGKFALDNTLMYQNVSDNDALNVPEFIARNTFYYTDEVFKKALKFQAGFTLNYFTEYFANGYDPLLAEFYTQNTTKIGGFPRLDLFINAKVRQTRIYFKAEHFNASFTGFDYFSAPNHPYRDFVVRFGLVWNFFL